MTSIDRDQSIFAAYRNGKTAADLAREHGISTSRVRAIVANGRALAEARSETNTPMVDPGEVTATRSKHPGRTGRPRTAAADRRGRFSVRLSDDEYADLRRRAYREGTKMHNIVLRSLGYEAVPKRGES